MIKKILALPVIVLVAAFAVTGCDRKDVDDQDGVVSDASSEDAVRNEAQLVTDREVKKAREAAEDAADEMSDAAQETADEAKKAAEAAEEEAEEAADHIEDSMDPY